MIYRCPEDNRVMDATTTKGKFKCPRCGKFWDAIVHTAPDGLALADKVIAMDELMKDYSPRAAWLEILQDARALREKASGK